MDEVQFAASLFIILCWLGWAILWAVLSRGNKTIVRREDALSRALHIGPMWIAGALLAFGGQPGWVLSLEIVTRKPWFVFAGALLVVIGLGFAIDARRVIAGNWSGVVTLKQDHKLVRTGPYRLVRHPIYTGLLLAMFGNVVAIDEWRALLAVAIVLAAFLRKMRTEEEFMTEAFGAEYRNYCAVTPALVPGLPGSRGG